MFCVSATRPKEFEILVDEANRAVFGHSTECGLTRGVEDEAGVDWILSDRLDRCGPVRVEGIDFGAGDVDFCDAAPIQILIGVAELHRL